jgi:hypothetical protein
MSFSIYFARFKSLHQQHQSRIAPKKGFQMRNTLLIVIAFGFADAPLLYAQQPAAPAAPMPAAAPVAPAALPPTPKVQFTVSVIAEAAKTFRKTLKSSQKYKDSKCEERAADHEYHKMDLNWPRKLDDDDNLYVRFFYFCSKPDAETYAVFGSASLAAAKKKAISGNDDKEDFEAVRVVADTDWGGGGGHGCQIWTCPNGTAKKALYPTCTPAC